MPVSGRRGGFSGLERIPIGRRPVRVELWVFNTRQIQWVGRRQITADGLGRLASHKSLPPLSSCDGGICVSGAVH